MTPGEQDVRGTRPQARETVEPTKPIESAGSIGSGNLSSHSRKTIRCPDESTRPSVVQGRGTPFPKHGKRKGQQTMWLFSRHQDMAPELSEDHYVVQPVSSRFEEPSMEEPWAFEPSDATAVSQGEKTGKIPSLTSVLPDETAPDKSWRILGTDEFVD